MRVTLIETKINYIGFVASMALKVRQIAEAFNSHHHQGVIVPSAKSVCIQISHTRFCI